VQLHCTLRAGIVFLEVRSSNKTAFHIYHRLGFNEIGIRKNYYPSEKGREDAIVLELELREEADFYYVDNKFISNDDKGCIKC
jgi:ribosomal protein S18 acetylase RimI-like enzyme